MENKQSIFIGPIYVRARQAAARYSVSIAWFRKLVADGRLPPPLKLGRTRCWHTPKLDQAYALLLAGSNEAGQHAVDGIERLLVEPRMTRDGGSTDAS